MPQSKLQQLESYDKETFRQKIMQLYDSLNNIADYQSKMIVADQLFEMTLNKDEQAHLHSLLFRAMNAAKNETGLFEQAYRLALNSLHIDDINNVEYSRARFYLAHKQYDSAMFYLLRYRDRTPPDLKGEGYRNVINLLGDIYYQAGLYNRAGEVYSGILELYEIDNNWNFFRPYVMMNNLGQIAFKTGEFKLAWQWHTKSLELAKKHLNTSYQNNILCYTKIKLAEVAIAQDSLDLAERLLNEASDFPENDIHEDVRQEYLFTRAKLLLKNGRADEALAVANELLPGPRQQFSKNRFYPEIYGLFADIYTLQDSYYDALQYANRYRHTEDSLKRQEHLAASMIALADYNHTLTRDELERTRNRVMILAAILVLLLLITLAILIFYRKLYRSKLEIMHRFMEKEHQMAVKERQDRIGNDNKNGYANGNFTDEESKKQKQLIKALTAHMEQQKPYLDSGLKIVDVARELSTNRTYLSKAINNQLETTFPNFINQYRIRESIRWILSGYTANQTQEALAGKAGFANRSVFMRAFKKHTCVLPSFFIANYKKWNQKKNRFNDDE